MPAIETLDLEQYAVLWIYTGVDAFGQESFGSPANVKVRWNQRQSKVTDAKGNTTILDGKVIYSQKVPLRSAMWLGSQTTKNALGEYIALQNSGASGRMVMRLETEDITPDIKARNNRFEFGLKRYEDVLMPLS